jgi:hypothetical protein
VYATTTTDKNSLVIVLERAKFRDLKSYYEGIIKNKKNPESIEKWNPGTLSQNYLNGYYGFTSILPWSVVGAEQRMIYVF